MAPNRTKKIATLPVQGGIRYSSASKYETSPDLIAEAGSGGDANAWIGAAAAAGAASGTQGVKTNSSETSTQKIFPTTPVGFSVEGSLISRHDPSPQSSLLSVFGNSFSQLITSQPDRINDMEGITTSRGYPIEKHEVTTSDGYKLTNFRIPNGRANGPEQGQYQKRPPVLLVHGISLSSVCWVINDEESSLAYILADRGYDVWMMNTRGNTFSRGHASLSESDSEFWKITVDDMALGDLPATMQYIIQVTGFDKVSYVGHSQGGTMLLALLARHPSFGTLFDTVFALAPVIHAKYMLSPVLVSFCRASNYSALLAALPPSEFLFMSQPVQAIFLKGNCQIPAVLPVCVAAVEGMFGSSKYIGTADYRRYMRTWPSSTSFWNALQWSQMFNEPSARFFAFNYGSDYDLTRIETPIHMFSGGRDVLAAPRDVQATSAKLRRAGMLAAEHVHDDFGHMDYIWNLDAKRSLYPLMLNILGSPAQRMREYQIRQSEGTDLLFRSTVDSRVRQMEKPKVSVTYADGARRQAKV